MREIEFIVGRVDYDNGTRLIIKIGNWKNYVDIPDGLPVDKIADAFAELAKTIRESNA